VIFAIVAKPGRRFLASLQPPAAKAGSLLRFYVTAEQAAEKIAHLTTGAKAEHLKQYART
jgi:hypothetical protein